MSAPVLALLLSLFVGITTSAPTTRIQALRSDGTPQTVELDDDEKMTPQKIDMMVSMLSLVDEYVPQEVKGFLSNMTDAEKAQLATFVNDVQSGKFVTPRDQSTIEASEALLKEKYPKVYARMKTMEAQLQTKFKRLSQETKAFFLKSVEALLDIAKQSDPEKTAIKVLDFYKEISASYASATPIVRTDVEREWPELHRLFTSEKVLQNVRLMQQYIALKAMKEGPLKKQMEESLRKQMLESLGKQMLESLKKQMQECRKKQMLESQKKRMEERRLRQEVEA